MVFGIENLRSFSKNYKEALAGIKSSSDNG